MVLSGKSSKALKTLRQVAIFNGKKEEGEKLSLEVEAKRDCSLGPEAGLYSWAVPSSGLWFPCSQAYFPSEAPSKLV